MPTSIVTLSLETTAAPGAIFDRLTRLSDFGTWLPRSGIYHGTTDVPAVAVRLGSRYVDRTPVGDMAGEVVEFAPERLIAFQQGTRGGDLSARITYTVTATSTGAAVTRVGVITTAGFLALLHPIVVSANKAENRRTMKHLKATLDSG